MSEFTVFDLRGIETDLLQGLGILLLMVANLGGRLVLQKLRYTLSADQRAELEDAAEKSLAWGIVQAEALIKQHGWDHASVKTAILDHAATYALTRFADVLKRSKVKPDSVKLAGILERKLPAATAAAHAVMSTVPAGPMAALEVEHV